MTETANRGRGCRRRAACALAAMLAAAGAGAPGAASAQPAPGGPPAVEIDRSVLDALGSAPAPRAAPARATGPDGLPIYDAREGPPRSRFIERAAPGPREPAPVLLRRPRAAPAAAARAVEAREGAPPAPPGIAALPPPRPVAPPPPPTRPADTASPMPAGAAPDAGPAMEDSAAPPEIPPPPGPAPMAPEDSAPAASPFAAPVSVPFDSGDSELSAAGRPAVEGVLAALAADPALGVRLKAYAAATGITPSAARRLSLLRALAVRSRLIEGGIPATRIDVRALGAKYEGGSPDRVDIVGVR